MYLRLRCLNNATRTARCVLPFKRTAATVAASTSNAFLGLQQPIKLRNYQEECIQSVLAYLQDGKKRLGVSLATGSGKTVIFTQLIDRIPHDGNATQTLILAHRRELVEQAANHCRRAYPHKQIDIELGNLHASGHADITVASVQSITSGDRIKKFDPNLYKLVLVDEAHHIVSPTYLRVLEYFGLLNDSAKRMRRSDLESVPALIGVSATFSRFDGLKLGHAIDHIVYHKDYVDMIIDKWLCDVIFTTVKTNANLKRVRASKTGDFLPSALSKAVNTNETNELTVRSWIAKASNRKSTIVFCVDLSHVFGLTAVFRAHGIESHFVTGDTPNNQRSRTLDAFKNGKFPVLLNCGVFTEGTDIPNIDCVLLARPTKSRNLLIQMIGRGMRLHPGKKNCHIIDFVASLETGIVTTPTLFGLDPEELVDEAGTEDMKNRRERREREERVKQGLDASQRNVAPVGSSNSLGNVVFTDYSLIDDLIDDTSGERHIRVLSPYAWVQVDSNRFVLSTQGGDYLQLRLDSDSTNPLWTVLYTQKIPSHTGARAPYRAPRIVAASELFEHGLRAADTFAGEEFPHQFISKTAPWRSYPASEAQIAFINKVRSGSGKSEITTRQLTKGRAGDMITKIKFGARGRFRRQVAEINTKKRAFERVKKLKQREEVRVGPLSRDTDEERMVLGEHENDGP